VLQYHRRVRAPGQLEVHSLLHAVVETQLARDDLPKVAQTLERLRRSGLDRHDALHAIAWVLSKHLHRALDGTGSVRDPNRAYATELRRLDAQDWVRSISEE
jgi:hypothetical protein